MFWLLPNITFGEKLDGHGLLHQMLLHRWLDKLIETEAPGQEIKFHVIKDFAPDCYSLSAMSADLC
jgi:hypothetical protein